VVWLAGVAALAACTQAAADKASSQRGLRYCFAMTSPDRARIRAGH